MCRYMFIMSRIHTMESLGEMFDHLKQRMVKTCSMLSYRELKDMSIMLQIVVVLLFLRFVIAGNASKCTTGKRGSLLSWIINRYSIAKEGKTHKLAESIWYLCWHIISFSFTLHVLKIEYGTPLHRKWLYYFVRDCKGIWFFSENQASVARKMITWPHLTMTPEARTFILLTMGFWVSCCIYIHWETRRSDMRIMQFHHLTTVVLVVLNYKYSFHRIGLIVILLHDIPDILLYTTKCLSYLRSCKQLYVAVSYVSYGLTHFLLRLVLMARYVAYPILSNMEFVDIYGGALGYIWTLPGGALCLCLLATLTVMNIYWLNLIISMGRIFARGIEISDHREKDD